MIYRTRNGKEYYRNRVWFTRWYNHRKRTASQSLQYEWKVYIEKYYRSTYSLPHILFGDWQ